ncbi:MAG: DUF1289 domain-containing protein [Rickettsiales bacterium]|nr:DUF1289 domain-containing protein [Rickettsiales bacterium]|tara:strand:- start:882 stop:1046 length:165 start_codon:yes stop_codon:yes gene_type:complete
MKIKSPCINVCDMDPKTGLCIGCHRTSDEIAKWKGFNENEKKKILRLLRDRKNV